MLVSKENFRQTIINHIQKNIDKSTLSWSNIGNSIIAGYVVKNKIDEMIAPLVLKNNMINIRDLEELFLEKIDQIKKENPSLIGSKGELYRIGMINMDYVITEQEVRDLIQEIKAKAINNTEKKE